MQLSSRCVRDPEFKSINPPHQIPLVAASSFVFDSVEQGLDIFDGKQEGHIYGRFGNPTIDAVASKIANLESHGLGIQAHGLFCSSGMSAIATVMLGCVPAGKKVLCQADLYGGTSNLIQSLESRGVGMINADLLDVKVAEQTVKEQGEEIAVIYVETPTNPTLKIIDLEKMSELAQSCNALLVVDNTFATSLVQQPLKWGADIIVHSTTKYLNGHGTGIAGAIVCRDEVIFREKLTPVYRLVGGNGNPWDAWLVLNGLKTLPLRMERHSENAQRVAEWLANHSAVSKVNYPGLNDHPQRALAGRQMSLYGGMLSFELKGGTEAAMRCMNRFKFCTLTPTLGDVDTLVMYPAGMSHRGVDPAVRKAHGISDGLIRLSIGVEAIEDILEDLDQAIIAG
jgi:methionine-gamma-lyase